MKNLKKRGTSIAWQKLIQYAIGAIVLVILGFIVAGPLIKDSPIVAKILNYALPKYIEPDQGITYNEFKVSERITVANSLKALACGINTVALSKDDINDVDNLYCDREYSPTEDIVRKLDITPGNDAHNDKIAAQIALEIAECIKIFEQSPTVKILPCVQLNPIEQKASTPLEGQPPVPDQPIESKIISYTIDDIQSKVWSEIEKLSSADHEGATQMSTWLPDVWFANRFNWDSEVGNTLTSDTYICIKDTYQVYVTKDATLCGLKQKTKCNDDSVSIKRNYGSTCMYCEKSKRATDSVDLSTDKSAALKQLTEATTRCWKDFRKGDASSRDLDKYENRHCAKFRIPSLQDTQNKNFQISEEEFCRALSEEDNTGSDMVGIGSCSGSWWNIIGLLGEQYEWKLNGPITQLDQETFIFMCGDSSGNIPFTKSGAEVFLTQNPDIDCPVKKEENIVNKFKCNVVGFELPQDITDDSYATNYINSLGDPKYLAYYQKFPKEEEYAWQYDPKTIISYTLGIRAGLAVVTAAFPIAKSAFKSAMVGKNIDEAARLAQSLDKIDNAAIRKETVEQIVKLVGSSDEGIAAVLKTSIHSQAYLAEAFTSHITDDLLVKIASETAEASGRLSEQGIARIASSFEKNLAELGIENSAVRAKQLSTTLTSGNKEVLKGISLDIGHDVTAAIASQNTKLLGYATQATKKIGFENFLKASLSPANFKETNALIKSSFESLNMLKQSHSTLTQTVVTNLARNTKDSVISLVENGVPCVLAAGTIGLSAAAAVESYGILAQPAYQLSKKAISIAAPRCTKAAASSYFPIIVGVSFLMQKQDSKERKYASIGENNIGVVQPAAYETDAKLFTVERAKNHYVIMTKDETQKPNRMFFASPCKTDIEITQNYCSCQVTSNQAYYEVVDMVATSPTARRQPIEKLPGINPEFEVSYPWPNWQALDEQERLKYLSAGSERLREEIKREKESKGITSKKVFIESRVPPGLWLFDYMMRQYPSENSEFFKQAMPDKLTFLKIVNELGVNSKKYSYSMALLSDEEFSQLSVKIDALTPEQYLDFISKFGEFISKQNIAVREQVDNCPHTNQESRCIITKEFIYSQGPKEVPDDGNPGIRESTIKIPSRLASIFLEQFIEGEVIVTDNGGYTTPSEFSTSLFSKQILSISYFKDKKNSAASDIIESRAKALFNSQYFDEKMREFSFKLYKYTGKNKADAIKVCREPVQQAVPRKLDRSVAETAYETIPCISVKPENMQTYVDENWNEGKNYCYSGDNPKLKIASEILSWTSIAGGIALTVTTGGIAAAVVPAALELGSVAMDFMVEKCTTWPNHQAQGIIDCIF